jgi:hypothetical protein
MKVRPHVRTSDRRGYLDLKQSGFVVWKRTPIQAIVRLLAMVTLVTMGAAILIYYDTVQGMLLAIGVGSVIVYVGRKLEQFPPDFGTACLVDSRYVGEIVERGVDILRHFEYQGISEVEFIYDERDRDFKLLDINTRVWKWIGLPIRAGVELT